VDFRSLREAAAIAAVLSLTSSVPETYAAVVPAMPHDATDQQVAEWARDNLESPAEPMIAREDGLFVFIDALAIQPTAEGLIANVRVELGDGPLSIPPVRSIKERMEFDCGAPRVRLHSSRTFPNHLGEGAEHVVEHNADWVPVEAGDLRRTVRDRVCQLAPLAGTADWQAALPSPPTDLSETATSAWAANLRMGDEIVIAHGKEGLYLIDRGELREVSGGRVRFTLRTERFWPLGSPEGIHRSTRRQVEADCGRLRYILEATERYEGANLLGEPLRTSDPPLRWREALAGEDEVRWIRAACTLAHAPATPVAEASHQPETPPPTGADKHAWEWIARNLNIQGYMPLATVQEAGATFYRVRELSVRPNGNLVIGQRRERFTPIATANGPVRSEFAQVEYDCRGYRQRVLSSTKFSESNLEGRAFAGQTGDWSPPFPSGSFERANADRLCGLRELVLAGADLSLALPPPPRNLKDEEMDAWLAQYIRQGDDALAGYAPQGVWLYSTSPLEVTSDGYVRAWTRIERFETTPSGARSQRLLQEFDCAESRSRILVWQAHPGANLMGAKTEVQDSGQWTFDPPASLQSRIGKAICATMEQQQEAGSSPRLPRLRKAPEI
jgi:hypothetical protein